MAETWQKIRVLFLVVLPLAAVVAAIVLFWNQYVHAKDLLLLALFYVPTTLGVTIGYHRMLTHQGFESNRLVRLMFLILGCMACEGTPLDWAATHIKHHAHSDDDGDPHSPLHGFWHAHMGWLFSKKNFADAKTYAPHLLDDPVTMFVDKYSWVWFLLTVSLPFLLGGWTGLIWGAGVRIFLTTHVTWSVNSVCHTFGKREFETTDESRNEWIVGLLAFGEGWHNNHHAFPRNAFHGLRWWQVDFSGLLIRALERLGLIWNVQRVAEPMLESHKVNALKRFDAVKTIRAQLLDMLHHAQEEISRLRREYGKVPITPEEIDETVTACESALKRLEEIQKSVLAAHHVRKQKLDAYVREVQQMVGALKARVSPSRV
ncbi:hypothetical protein A3D88_02720 [Candidatus Peribacteria bacterium RIFCSPHIGHO2_02_FULL_52_16]|nr:MAG: hypothetical protein A2706_00545 [Candidatus Peribacteria bacterium RIFCSPHIGHO2_01_FULL_51_35]OGJ61672.1 MAG: hypothetical protein A3D88_02720 [Candidatus Peribacteria bacterium RIFCSPHIGHO2_02_FULL_52_16]